MKEERDVTLGKTMSLTPAWCSAFRLLSDGEAVSRTDRRRIDR